MALAGFKPTLCALVAVSTLGGGRAAAQSGDRAASSPLGYAPMVWPECRANQVRVLILGSVHFHQTAERDDILLPGRQEEVGGLLDLLGGFAPDRVAVEFAQTRQAELDAEYAGYRRSGLEGLSGLSPRNEIVQIGFRLAERLELPGVFAVDVPMNLWHDSIAVFDERHPGSRDGLRRRWPVRYRPSRRPSTLAELPLLDLFRRINSDAPPANSDLYGGFLPLVEGGIYAGALKLRPWYDRNLRMIQNFFRVLEPGDERLLFVVGHGHLRILKQMLEFVPQLCPVDPLTVLAAPSG